MPAPPNESMKGYLRRTLPSPHVRTDAYWSHGIARKPAAALPISVPVVHATDRSAVALAWCFPAISKNMHLRME